MSWDDYCLNISLHYKIYEKSNFDTRDDSIDY